MDDIIKGIDDIKDVTKPLENHSSTINGKIPMKSTPNSSIDYVDDTGNMICRRYYDNNGKVIKDIDYTDHATPIIHTEVPHEHYWEWNGDTPTRK